MELAEISGSDSFVHVHTAAGELVVQLTGVHFFDLGAAITLHLDPAAVHVFGADGRLLRAPRAWRAALMARIDLELAHSYKPNPQAEADYALLPLKMTLRRRRRLCAAGPLGLRQDDHAQHHLGPGGAVAWHGEVRRRRP